MQKTANLKAIITIILTIFIVSIVNAQNQSTSPVKSNQLSESIQKNIDAIAHTIRTDILTTIKAPLELSQDYPLKIKLSYSKEGPMIVGMYSGLIIMGHATMAISDSETGISSSVSDSLASSEKPIIIQKNIVFVGNPPMPGQELTFHIEHGEYFCSGNFSIKDIPMYFERGTMICTDAVKPCTFSEGSSFFLDTVNYIYSKGNWIKN
jgi:hypothetical protein